MRFVPITRAHVAALLLAAGITTTAALAALPAKDGTLPMYLHAAQIPGSKDSVGPGFYPPTLHDG